VISGLNDITVQEGELVEIKPVVSDPDGDEFTVTISKPVGNDGAPSFGTTNSEGQYELQMSPRLKGATPGDNLVAVNFEVIELEEGEEAPATESPNFKILKPFADGTFKVTVRKGPNTMDLEIAAE